MHRTNRLMVLLFFIFTILFSVKSKAREVIPLNNDWEFIKTEFNIDFENEIHSWQKVNIPHTWNNLDAQSGEGFYAGTAWYRRIINFDQNLDDKRVFLRFEGVGQDADVYLNGHFIGNHKGSYSAFAFEITKEIKSSEENELYVRVNNEAVPEIIPQNHFLFTIFGGIYRPVSLIITDKINISVMDFASPGVYIRQEKVNKTSAEFSVTTKLENKTFEQKKIKIITRILDASGKPVEKSEKKLVINPTGFLTSNQQIKIKKPHLWQGRKDPYLYQVMTAIELDGKIIDEVKQPLGLRYFHIDKDKGFFLNGEPYRLFGVCRHQEWENYGNALSKAQHKTDMELIYEIGATAVRLAHYQQADYIYSLCDSMGIIVWAEIPFVNTWSGKESENAKQQLIELIRQNYNHPSIVIWGLHNEVHNKPDDDYPTRLTKILNNIAKSEDPDRFTVSVSNIWWILQDPIHFNADLQGFNQYTGWYGGKPYEIEKWIDNYRKKFPDIPCSISEYGAGGVITQQSANDTTPPNPTGKLFPEGYQTHYHEIKWAIFEKYPFLWATYVWNMFDFTCPLWERAGIKGRNHKGLITYDRKVKKDAFFWYKANWSDEPVLYITGRRYKNRSELPDKFTVYCNFATPILEVNGQVVEGRVQGGTSVHYIWENVDLNTGENIIRTYALKNGEKFEDSYSIFVEPNAE
jgi:beta-galactosidase